MDAIYFTASRQELEHTAARRGDPAASTRRPRVCADRRTSFRWTDEVKTRLEGPSTVRRALTRLRRDTRPSSPVHLLNGWRSSRGQPRLNRLDCWTANRDELELASEISAHDARVERTTL